MLYQGIRDKLETFLALYRKYLSKFNHKAKITKAEATRSFLGKLQLFLGLNIWRILLLPCLYLEQPVHLLTLGSPCVRPVIAGFVVAPTQTHPALGCRGEYFVLSTLESPSNNHV